MERMDNSDPGKHEERWMCPSEEGEEKEQSSGTLHSAVFIHSFIPSFVSYPLYRLILNLNIIFRHWHSKQRRTSPSLWERPL